MKKALYIFAVLGFMSFSVFLQAQEITRFKEDKNYGYKSDNGNTVIKPIYEDASWSFSDGMAAVKQNGKWGFINDKGKEIIPIKYDDVGITRFQDGEGYKVYFYEDLLCVYNDKKWGVVDKNGKEVVPMKYQFVAGFSDGIAAIQQNGKWGFINKKGVEVITPIYDNVNKMYGYCFEEGLAGVEINGKWGFINKEGDLVIPCKYDRVSYFKEGKAWVKVGDEYIDIDKSGKELKKEKAEVKTTVDNLVYRFVSKKPEFKDGIIAFQNEILSDMVQNPILKNGSYNISIIINKDETIEVKTISASGVVVDKEIMDGLGSIIESKKVSKCGYHNNNPVRVLQSLYLKLNDEVRQNSNINNKKNTEKNWCSYLLNGTFEGKTDDGVIASVEFKQINEYPYYINSNGFLISYTFPDNKELVLRSEGLIISFFEIEEEIEDIKPEKTIKLKLFEFFYDNKDFDDIEFELGEISITYVDGNILKLEVPSIGKVLNMLNITNVNSEDLSSIQLNKTCGVVDCIDFEPKESFNSFSDHEKHFIEHDLEVARGWKLADKELMLDFLFWKPECDYKTWGYFNESLKGVGSVFKLDLNGDNEQDICGYFIQKYGREKNFVFKIFLNNGVSYDEVYSKNMNDYWGGNEVFFPDEMNSKPVVGCSWPDKGGYNLFYNKLTGQIDEYLYD